MKNVKCQIAGSTGEVTTIYADYEEAKTVKGGTCDTDRPACNMKGQKVQTSEKYNLSPEVHIEA